MLGHVVRHPIRDGAPQHRVAVVSAAEITIDALSWIAVLSVAAALLLRESLTCLLPIRAARNLAEPKRSVMVNFTTRMIASNVTVIQPKGRLNMAAASMLRKQLQQAREQALARQEQRRHVDRH